MTLRQALAVLAASDAAAKGSFLYHLHERADFDRASFWKLVTAMTIVAERSPRARGGLAQEHAFHVYEYVLNCMIYHYRPQDGRRLRRLPERKLYDYLDRLRWVFAPVIRGVSGYGWPAKFDDGLKNPHEAALERYFRRSGKKRSGSKR